MVTMTEYSFLEASNFLTDKLGGKYTVKTVINLCVNGRLLVGYRMMVEGVKIPICAFIPPELTPLLMTAYSSNRKDLFDQYHIEAEKINANLFYAPPLKDLVIYRNDLEGYIQEKTKRPSEAKTTKPQLTANVIEKMGLNPLAFRVGDSDVRKLYEECKMKYPDKFRMNYESFKRNTFKEAKKKGLIVTIDSINDN